MKKNKSIAWMIFVSAVILTGTGQGFAQTCGDTTWALTAGQTINVGTVGVSNDMDNIYITYTLTYPDATFGTLHLWVGNDISNVPANPNGTPVPGQFCNALGGACYDAAGLTTYTFTIPFADINLVDAATACNLPLYVVTHAEVDMNGGTETAFGGDKPGSGPRWWFYGVYSICCDFGPPPICEYETAYAKGGYVWTTDKKSNPEKLPSLNLTKNRWGWAINLTATGSTTYDIWAGAGLNNTANGTKVGTLTVDWTGTTVTATYTMFSGSVLKEVHLYAEDGKPTTTAPGQYGNLEGFDAGVTSHTFSVDVSDSGSDGIWLVAHAVVADSGCAK